MTECFFGILKRIDELFGSNSSERASEALSRGSSIRPTKFQNETTIFA